MNLKNRLVIYIIFMIISIIFLFFLYDNSIVSGLCCSTFSAIFLAIVIDIKDYYDRKQEILKRRKIYFKTIEDEIENLINKIFWLDILFDEGDHVLDNDSKEFNSVRFMCYVGENYKNVNIDFSYEELKNKFLKLEEKYSLDSIKKWICQK